MTLSKTVTGPSQIESEQRLQGDVFTLRCQFKRDDIAITVTGPRMRMRRKDSEQYVPFRAPGSVPLGTDFTTWSLVMPITGNTVYTIDIDPLSLEEGWYEIMFLGEHAIGAETIHLRLDGTIEITALSRYDRIAHRVLTQVADTDIEDYIDAAGPYLKFRAQTVLTFIADAIQWINVTGPRRDEFTMTSLPESYEWVVQQYAVAMLMFAKARNFIDNDLQISDTHSLAQQKYEKYLRLYEMGMREAKEAAQGVKKAEAGSLIAGFKRRKWPIMYYWRGLATTSSSYWSGSYAWTY